MSRRTVVLGDLNSPVERQKLIEYLIDLYYLVNQAIIGSTQTLAATATIVPNANYIPVAGSGGAVTLTSNPSINAGFRGQRIVLKGTSDTNTLALTNGNGMKLQAGTRTLGNNDCLELWYDGTNWIELSFANN